MPKKILCISLGYGGGCVFYANHILQHMDTVKEVWISSYSDEPFASADVKVPVRKGLKNMLWGTLWILPWYLLKVHFGLVLGKYSKVLVFGPHNWDLAFLFAFRLWRKPTYYVVHDGIMHTGEGHRIHQILLTQCIKTSTNLVFLSENVRRLVAKKIGIQKPSVLIPHGIVRYNSLIPVVSLLPKRPTFLMIGRISWYKGVDLLFGALPLLDFARIGRIVIAGECNATVRIPDMSIYPQVTLCDKWLSEVEFDAYVRETDFILMPYREATQSGIAAVSIGYLKPAIVTRVGAMEEQFGSAALYMEEISEQSLADTIRRACDDSERYSSLQQELQILSERYSWKSLAGQLVEFIQAKR